MEQNTTNTIIYSIIGIVVVLALIFGVIYVTKHSSGPGMNATSTLSGNGTTSRDLGEETRPATAAEKSNIETYLRTNISKLSPRPATMGGKFYVTSVDVENAGRATVEYEDGHNKYTAAVGYIIDANGNVKITGFDILEK